MGRKPAPEPLPLGFSTAAAAQETQGLASSSASNNRTGETAQQPKFVHHSSTPNSPQTSLASPASPASPTSAKPARSPFGRFGNAKKSSSSSRDHPQTWTESPPSQSSPSSQDHQPQHPPPQPSPSRRPYPPQTSSQLAPGGDKPSSNNKSAGSSGSSSSNSTGQQPPPLPLRVTDAVHRPKLTATETETATEAETETRTKPKNDTSNPTSTSNTEQPAENHSPYTSRAHPNDAVQFPTSDTPPTSSPSALAIHRVSEDSSRNGHADQNLQHSHTQPVPGQSKTPKSGFFFFKSSSKQTATGRASPDPGLDMSRDSDHNGGPAKHADSFSFADHPLRIPNSASNSRTDVSLQSTTENEGSTPHASGKKLKPKPFNILGRNKARDIDSPSPKDHTQGVPEPVRIVEPEPDQEGALRTAPVKEERSFREMMSSAVRNHSADRSIYREVGPSNSNGAGAVGAGTGASASASASTSNGNRDAPAHRDHSRHHPSSARADATFFGNLIKNSSNKAADMLFSKGIFKGGRGVGGGSGGDKDRDVDDEHYQLKVIGLPLVEQTRKTRISKRLEQSRDKTEFWMPSFPWRAIDYLNYKGADVEGLYRVPGSGQQVKKWQRRFDEELDIDLYKQADLYDINIIGSMLKAWLRELPDELFPKDAQDRVARECAGADKVPQMLVDELSNLPPFNYYLLFAITCHLSLLLAHSDKNKMDFRNLCICFQPCMRIDAFSFKFLVCDWRDCWQGCKNEGRYIEEEYRLFDLPPPRGLAEPRRPITQPSSPSPGQPLMSPAVSPGYDDVGAAGTSTPRTAANASSQGSTTPTPSINSPPDAAGYKGRTKMRVPASESAGSVGSNATISTTLTVNNDRQGENAARPSGDLRPLSPIKPLSPLNF